MVKPVWARVCVNRAASFPHAPPLYTSLALSLSFSWLRRLLVFSLPRLLFYYLPLLRSFSLASEISRRASLSPRCIASNCIARRKGRDLNSFSSVTFFFLFFVYPTSPPSTSQPLYICCSLHSLLYFFIFYFNYLNAATTVLCHSSSWSYQLCLNTLCFRHRVFHQLHLDGQKFICIIFSLIFILRHECKFFISCRDVFISCQEINFTLFNYIKNIVSSIFLYSFKSILTQRRINLFLLFDSVLFKQGARSTRVCTTARPVLCTHRWIERFLRIFSVWECVCVYMRARAISASGTGRACTVCWRVELVYSYKVKSVYIYVLAGVITREDLEKGRVAKE